MPEAKSLHDLMRIRAHNREYLDSINNDLGTALGFKKPTNEELTQTPAVIVFVPLKINPKWIPKQQLLPKKLEGPDGLWCLLDVVEGGKATEQEIIPVPDSPGELAERLRGWDEQVWSGSQISHWKDEANGIYSTGTIAAFASELDSGHLGFLTNQHVAIKPGQKLFHPVPWGTHMATTKKAIELAEDQEWYGQFIDEPNTQVRIDCAFAEIESSFNKADLNTQMMGVGQLGETKNISLDDMSIIGQKVLRVGRTTGLRYGTIVAFGYEWNDGTSQTVYTDLLIVGDDGIPFSTHGDSGSLIVTNDKNHNPVGLLWGGWQEKLRTGYAQENWTYAIALSRVLDVLNIDLVLDDFSKINSPNMQILQKKEIRKNNVRRQKKH
jgi:hypothetical protein